MRQVLAVVNTVLIMLIVILSGRLVLDLSYPVKARNTEQMTIVKNYIAQEKPKLSSLRYNKLKFDEAESDLYLTLYNEIVLLSDEKARRSFNSNQAPGTIQLEDIIADSAEDLEDIQLEREFFELLARHEAEIFAAEMFVNGNTKDAEFDLLKDLEQIEKLLFDESSESQFQESIERSAENLEELADKEGSLLGEEPRQEDIRTDVENSSEALSLALAQQYPLELDPTACQIDEDLSQNLQDYNESIGQASQEVEANNSNGYSSGSGSVSGETANKRLPLGEIESSQKSCPEDAMFCVTTEKIMNTAYSYLPSDSDCINCLLEEIEAKSDELISQSLASHELPGEPFQPNINVKSFALNSLKLELNLLKKPLTYPDESDILTSSSAGQIAEEIASAQSTSADPNSDVISSGIESASSDGTLSDNEANSSAQEALERQSDQARIRSYLAEVQAVIDTNEVLVSGLNNRMQASLTYYESLNEIVLEILNIMTSLNSDKPVCP